MGAACVEIKRRCLKHILERIERQHRDTDSYSASLIRFVFSVSADRGMRVVRVELNDADKVIGIRYPAYLVEEAKALVTAAQLERAAWSKTTQSTVEPVRPVDPKALAKATRPKLTMLSELLNEFFV
jgi:hypothetical protein